jgi:hypothetical protein
MLIDLVYWWRQAVCEVEASSHFFCNIFFSLLLLNDNEKKILQKIDWSQRLLFSTSKLSQANYAFSFLCPAWQDKTPISDSLFFEIERNFLFEHKRKQTYRNQEEIISRAEVIKETKNVGRYNSRETRMDKTFRTNWIRNNRYKRKTRQDKRQDRNMHNIFIFYSIEYINQRMNDKKVYAS